MGKMTAAPTVKTQERLDLRPNILRKLKTELHECALLQSQIKELKAELALHVEEVEVIRELSGVKSFDYEGFKITRVEGVTNYLDIDMMIEEGWISVTQKEDAMKTKPKKPYTLVTAPGDKE